MPALCPLCALDEYTAEDRTPDDLRFGSCANPEHGPESFVWEVTVRKHKRGRGSDGIGADLGVWDKLLSCVVPGEPAVAYGVVEGRFFERFPNEADTLLQAYGHRWKHPDFPSGQFSMSAYLATRLSELAEERHLEKTWGPATGEWAYNAVISYWRVPGPVTERVADTTSGPVVSAPVSASNDGDIARLAAAAAALLPAVGEYTETDFVTNLMATVLDYQQNTVTVDRAIGHYKGEHWEGIRTLEDLEERFGWHPDTQAGNTALAKALWGYSLWTRAHQLRNLAAFFRSIGVTDQASLEEWATRASFERDFRGKVKGLGPAVFQWLVMRQGVDTVKPDVHVRRFAEGVLGRRLGDSELVQLVIAAADHLALPARQLDWRIWEASRAGLLS